jgi:hypothetical protein
MPETVHATGLGSLVVRILSLASASVAPTERLDLPTVTT